MTKLGALCGSAYLALVVVASCSGDEKAKHAQEAAGEAGAELAGRPSADSGGGSNMPSAGHGGMPITEAGAGGAPGSEAGAPVGEGGAAAGEGGAAGGLDCPAQPGMFTYECPLTMSNFEPTFDASDGSIHFDVSYLPYPVVDGSVTFEFVDGENMSCGKGSVAPEGNEVIGYIGPVPDLLEVRIIDYTFIDACGGEHSFDPIGVACHKIIGVADTDWSLACEEVVGSACIPTCQ